MTFDDSKLLTTKFDLYITECAFLNAKYSTSQSKWRFWKQCLTRLDWFSEKTWSEVFGHNQKTKSAILKV